MEILIKVAQFILSLSLLVIIHEFGHFIFARIFKVRVEKFYLFFDPWFSLFKIKRGDTEYGIGWVPFGGYVKISGMIDESMDTEQMKQPAQPYEFRSKPAWQRLLIMAGGVIMNIILAICIYIGMSYTWEEKYIANADVKYGYIYNDYAHSLGFENGDRIVDVGGVTVDNFMAIPMTMIIDQAKYVTVERDGVQRRIDIPVEAIPQLMNSADFLFPRQPFIVNAVTDGGGAQAGGIQQGDTLVAFNGAPMRYLDQYRMAFSDHRGETAHISVKRDSAGITKTITLPVAISAEGVIGAELVSPDRFLPVTSHKYTFWQAIPQGFKRAGTEVSNYWKQIKLIFTPKTEAYKSVGGIISIGNMFPGEWNWYSFWSFTAFISIALAVFNILPIPALDGGHILFLLYEVITRRKPSDKFMEYTQMVGMILVFGLIIVITFNDIYKVFIK